jgi:hypothetical protein
MVKENVKLSTAIVDKVRKSKEKTGVPIGKFFEQAAEEKLKSSKAKFSFRPTPKNK